MSFFFLSLIQAMFPDTVMFRFCMLSASENGGDALPVLVIPDGDEQVLFMRIAATGYAEWHYNRVEAGSACLFTYNEIMIQANKRIERAYKEIEVLRGVKDNSFDIYMDSLNLGMDTETVLEKNEVWKAMEAEEARWAEIREQRAA